MPRAWTNREEDRTRPLPSAPWSEPIEQTSCWSRPLGGHLAHLLALEPRWRDHERIWVTFDKPDARSQLRDEDSVVWAHHPTTRNLLNLARNTARRRCAWCAGPAPTSRSPPGAGVAVPSSSMARLLRIPPPSMWR